MQTIQFSVRSLSEVNREEWNQLYLDSTSRNVYFSYAYVKSIVETLQEKFHPDRIIMGYCNDRLVIIQPIKLWRNGWHTKIEFFKPFMGDHIEPLYLEENKTEHLNALIDFIMEELKPDLIYGRALSEEFTDFLEHHKQLHVRKTTSYAVPYLTLPETLDEYWDKYKRKFRHELRRRIKVAENEGITMRVVEPHQLPEGYSMKAALENLNRLHGLRWGKKGFGTFDFSEPYIQAFHARFAEQKHCVMYPSFIELLHNGEVIGSRYALVTPHYYIGYYHTFNPEYHSFGIGNLLLYYSFKYAIERGNKVFDFKRGEGYKHQWTSEISMNHDMLIPVTWKGHLLVQPKRLSVTKAKVKSKLKHALSDLKLF